MIRRLLFAPVTIPAKTVRGIAWTRAAFGSRRPRVTVQRTVVVRTIVVVPPRPDLGARP